MITLTQTAATRIRQQLEQRGRGLGIRLGVKSTGCSGLAYVLEWTDAEHSGDLKIESEGCTLYIDPQASVYLNGTVIDWVRRGLSEGYEFINPNERDRCGCGESFRV